MPAPRILILTSGPLCRNPRVLKEAQTLGQAGFDTTVMTIANLVRFEEYDDEIMLNAPFKKIALDQISPGWQTSIAKTTNRLATWIARRATRIGWQSPQSLGPAYSLQRMADRFTADLTIVHTELPFHIGCRLLSRNRCVAADFEDWHSQDLLPDAQNTRPNRLIHAAEQRLLRECAYSSTTSHAMADALHVSHGGAKPLVFTNSFPLQATPSPRSCYRLPAFLWFSQTIGAGRGLEAFVEAWRQTTQPSRLVLLGDVSTHYRTALLRHVPIERQKHIDFLPIVSPNQLPNLIALHDIGLALEPNTPANKNYTISNKILQYFNAGLAVLATDTAGQREALQNAPDAGLIIALDRPVALAEQLDSLLSHPANLAALGTAARHAAEQIYSWEKEAPRLIAAVERTLKPFSP
jgi:glycosyltransferase involved in cell wall biosynthesis